MGKKKIGKKCTKTFHFTPYQTQYIIKMKIACILHFNKEITIISLFCSTESVILNK